MLEHNSAQKGEHSYSYKEISEANRIRLNVLKIWLDLHSNGSLNITGQIQQLIHIYFQLRHLILLQNTEPLMRETSTGTSVKKSQSE